MAHVQMAVSAAGSRGPRQFALTCGGKGTAGCLSAAAGRSLSGVVWSVGGPQVQEVASAPVDTDVEPDVAGDRAPAFDPTLFRRVMGSFASGVTVVTTVVESPDGPEVRGMTVSAFMSGSLEPPLCVISIRKASRMHPLLTAAGHFGVSILAKSQERISSHFAGALTLDFEPELVWAGRTPMLANAAAVIAADTGARYDCGDHTLLVGQIRHMAAAGLPPLLVHEGRYAGVAHATEPAPDWVVDIW
jgi:flavin reductase (DIM6/NTAB) family NADH-FMN oxidoreductase RutF